MQVLKALLLGYSFLNAHQKPLSSSPPFVVSCLSSFLTLWDLLSGLFFSVDDHSVEFSSFSVELTSISLICVIDPGLNLKDCCVSSTSLL